MLSPAKQPQTVPAVALLALLWLAVAFAVSMFAMHVAEATIRTDDFELADTGASIARMSDQLIERGAAAADVVSAASEAAKARGFEIETKSVPALPGPPFRPDRPIHEPQRVEVVPPPASMLGLPDPGREPQIMLHIGQTMLFMDSGADPVGRIFHSYLLAMLVLSICAVGSIWYVQSRTMTRALAPARTIEAALRRLSGGEYAKLDVVGGEPAEAAIVDAYNAAADELASSIRLRAEAEANLRLFLADAGHELRTPLTVIMGFVDVLRQGAISEQAVAQRILESVAGEGERMRTLISKLLLLARLDAVAPDRVEKVDLGRVALETVESFRPIAGTTVIDVVADPDVCVNAASSELRETIGILVDNALKYAPGSPIRVAIRREDHHAMLSVTDQGPGMPPDLQARAFDRFSRGDERGSIPGSGLGLAIVKRIATRAGGDVELVSTLGKGTSVSVRLPIASG